MSSSIFCLGKIEYHRQYNVIIMGNSQQTESYPIMPNMMGLLAHDTRSGLVLMYDKPVLIDRTTESIMRYTYTGVLYSSVITKRPKSTTTSPKSILVDFYDETYTYG